MHSFKIKRFSLPLTAAALMTVGACAAYAPYIDHDQYWQRVSASEAVYQQGPKAQQMLNRDIARCVTELRELERLGTIKNAIPTDVTGRVLDPDQKKLNNWDTPERDQYLLAEHGDYHDFESCMLDKGWERVKHVPYDVADKAKKTYYASQADRDDYAGYGENKGTSSNERGPYGNLND